MLNCFTARTLVAQLSGIALQEAPALSALHSREISKVSVWDWMPSVQTLEQKLFSDFSSDWTDVPRTRRDETARG